MKCLECQKLIGPYLRKKLTDKELNEFLDHVEHCPDCYEELEINMAVLTVADESSGNKGAGEYNFKRKLDRDIHQNRVHLRTQRVTWLTSHILLFAAEVILFLTVLTGVQLQRPEGRYGTSLYKWLHGAAPVETVAESETNVSETELQE